MPRLHKRSLLLLSLTVFLITLLVLSFCQFHHQLSRHQQHSQATNNVLRNLNKVGNFGSAVLPQSSTAILEPRPSFTCQGDAGAEGSDLFLIVIVISSPENLGRRNLIRSVFQEMKPTWNDIFFQEKKKNGVEQLNVTNAFKVLFFVGQSETAAPNHAVKQEWQEHGDLILDDLHESYLSLTVKTLRMLKWVLQHCAGANYLVKMDDDVFLNMPKLFSFLLSQPSGYSPKLIAGHLYNEVSVTRDPFSKWFTPEALYAPETFPSFVAGFCYILGMEAAQEVFQESKQLQLFHLEDVFLTGLVASKRLHYELQDLGNVVVGFMWYDYFRTVEWTQNQVIIHGVTPDQFRCWTRLTGRENSGWGNGLRLTGYFFYPPQADVIFYAGDCELKSVINEKTYIVIL